MKQNYDICWDIKAGKQLKKIYQYIKKHYSEKSAKALRKSIIDKIEELKFQPERYPPEPLLSDKKENLRYLVVENYKVIYEFKNQEVQILFIYSTRQNPEKLVEFFK